MNDLLNRIEQANKEIRTIGIERKDKDGNEIMYATVPERVKAFRKVYPGGLITAELIENSEQLIIIAAEIYNDQGELISTGYAKEYKNAGYVNKTSWLENCETSAIGRALGFAGFGIDTAIGTAEEVSAALIEQDRIKTEELRRTPIGVERAMALQSALEKRDVNITALCEQYKVESLEFITEEQMRAINVKLNKIDKENRKK